MKKLMFLGLALAGLAAPVLAHHSQSMFDLTKNIVVTGTVKKMIWTNPHCWLHVMVPQPDGSAVEWAIEMGPPVSLSRDFGWKKSSVKPGDKVAITAKPLADGRPGGALVGITLSDGTTLSRITDTKPPADAAK